MNHEVDVIILGGGPAGSSAGISLLEKNYSVAIIEKAGNPYFKPGETIAPGVENFFHKTGIDICFLHNHLPSYSNKSIWGNSIPVENNFFFRPPGHGWHLDRALFDRQLRDHAVQCGVLIFSQSNFLSIKTNNNGNWNISFTNNGLQNSISSRFAIDATGRNAVLGKQLGSKKINHDHLISITAIKEEPSTGSSNYTLVEAIESGWWYSADVPGNKTIFSFFTDADIYKRESSGSQNFLEEKLAAACFTKERSSTPLSLHSIWPANSFIMTKQYGYNWLSIGDAAMAYDPLSSSGIARALNDGNKAALAISSFLDGDKKAIENLAANYHSKFTKYLAAKRSYYSMEQRWPDSLFWKRRNHEMNYAGNLTA